MCYTSQSLRISGLQHLVTGEWLLCQGPADTLDGCVPVVDLATMVREAFQPGVPAAGQIGSSMTELSLGLEGKAAMRPCKILRQEGVVAAQPVFP